MELMLGVRLIRRYKRFDTFQKLMKKPGAQPIREQMHRYTDTITNLPCIFMLVANMTFGYQSVC